MNYKTRIITLLAIYIAWFGLPNTVSANSLTIIEVFSEIPINHTWRIPNTQITVYDFDQPNRAEKLLPTLSNNQQQAERQFEQWKASAQGKVAIERMRTSYAPYLRAARYNITKIPAIVFDKGKYVVYGTIDVHDAIQEYDHYQRTQGQKR